ncbi:MAG: hypothetical protein KC415_22560 [Anaerolineales bacterium]|nr:hypothetical protein [Anaerolineales bacterium]
MSKSKATNIVRMDWLRNRTPTGRRSATKARRLAQYLAFGRGRLQEQMERPQRGKWLDESGQIISHENVLQWVKARGMENLFTQQFILSVKDAALTPEAFNRAMSAGGDLFPEWRLIQHEDSRHPHAHALAFGQEEIRIKSEAFRQWWLDVRAALERERQAQIERERAQKLEHSLEIQVEQTAVSNQHQAIEKPEKSHQQGWGLG